eukprot:CAMPEP_0174983866 /NCGR_PEP_ID=MMETSP0004_2-20121128/17392_1 /TAXON_ID=420556 /ORGANISM="Ochromonas sp., Strain CCMP1393" /LENGTH=41 /DNA_ID= /DNA_START= /DNA_END= /DNA_ORIENTATION=
MGHQGEEALDNEEDEEEEHVDRLQEEEPGNDREEGNAGVIG